MTQMSWPTAAAQQMTDIVDLVYEEFAPRRDDYTAEAQRALVDHARRFFGELFAEQHQIWIQMVEQAVSQAATAALSGVPRSALISQVTLDDPDVQVLVNMPEEPHGCRVAVEHDSEGEIVAVHGEAELADVQFFRHRVAAR